MMIKASLISDVIYELDWSVFVGSRIINQAENSLEIISVEPSKDGLPYLNAKVDGKGAVKTYTASAFATGSFVALETHERGINEIKRALINRLDKFLTLNKRYENLTNYKQINEDFLNATESGKVFSIPSYFIMREVEASKIEYIIHATQLENLENIMKIGLVTRDDGRGTVVDAKRLDGRLDHISVSFKSVGKYIWRQIYESNGVRDWCVLRLDIKLLWQRKSLFFPSNAAKSAYQSKPSRPDKNFHSACAYKEMWFGEPFPDDKRYPDRPSDVQAEVQIPGNIPTDFINCICLHPDTSEIQREKVKAIVNRYAPKIKTVINTIDFSLST